MDNECFENTFPAVTDLEAFQDAAETEPEPVHLLEDSGSGEQQMEVVAAAAEPEPEQNYLLKNSGNGEQMEVAVVKRKRGRPRKELGEIRPEFRPVEVNSGGVQKRGRGRPKGSGKWQTWGAYLGRSNSHFEARASNLTPYVLDIQAGENIVEKIWSFSQKTSDSICILSASGTVSTADFYLPASRSSALRYEGHFSIASLNGSHTYMENSGAKTCFLSAQLANSDGDFCGGAVANSIIAAGPTQVIISTFKQDRRSKVTAASIAAPKPNEMNGRAAAPVQEENGGVVADSVTAADDDGDDDDEEEGMMDEPSSSPPSNISEHSL